MDQNGLKDLLLTLAAEVSAEYEKNRIDRNSKFDEIRLLNRQMEELTSKEDDHVFSPRNKLSSYDTKRSFEDQISRENLEMNRMDSLLDRLLNRKEELLEGVELLDSIIEEREEYYEELKRLSENNPVDEQTEGATEADRNELFENGTGISSDHPEEKTMPSDEIISGPDVEQLLSLVSTLAHQCGEISDHTIQDPYRARNELRAIAAKYGNG